MFVVELKAEAATAALTRAAALLEDMTPVMKAIGELLVRSTKQRFLKGQAPDGSAWKAKSPVTLARSRDSRPLFGPNNRLNREIFPESGSDFVEVGSPQPYAAMMQFGGTKARFPHLWGNIPARPFLGISQEDEDNILAEIAEGLSTAFGQQV